MPTSPNRITLKAMLEAEGFALADGAATDGAAEADVVIADQYAAAVEHAARMPVLVLATASQIGDAVAAMRKGVYGYIFLPLQPGEAGLMVRRACESAEARHQPLPHQQADIPLAEAETQLILDTLRRCRNNKTRAAKMLGIGRNTLWRKLAAIRPKQDPNPPEGG